MSTGPDPAVSGMSAALPDLPRDSEGPVGSADMPEAVSNLLDGPLGCVHEFSGNLPSAFKRLIHYDTSIHGEPDAARHPHLRRGI